MVLIESNTIVELERIFLPYLNNWTFPESHLGSLIQVILPGFLSSFSHI
ncbi:Uncharacterized protein BM_BM1170 [Brugia malayi]|uniref:Bm1170 n=1 Tax=Brugia malayi TaxID=6279 RepID=A0A0J9Y7L0_BRUMA|nr:Uncharacterized protein BM_BM1170 [Brugia malayi]CDQ03409.1 Bm1170 [Brugia malayi]VIO97701.1 Uncharacterized protein BM_BM1170 [Brugia malayi]